ncbi:MULTISPECIES: hypothetical protein [unclassified Paenibacillus]|uniref:hypothetical protein n=1 Tax=unclassified Paenibacillus TaxID=185978 RepID=UPI0009549CA7|nr:MULTISPECIES: hypothetical protein [unclassified Paenibacillus]ASS65926.1 hypothetical protein CIC07_07060 [Paenibacillus sp. RUD330]SIQ18515.1 hypothetical protein SAMN05880555_0946 [Paenibacillus sp. RU4X]SIQ40275.1 hypothetical protein SAMN05880570_0945 [Paenibacillus sp. RU4T]
MIDARLMTPLRRLGWGLALILIDIRLGTIDVLPDFIGYLMAASALGALAQSGKVFAKARAVAVGLALLSLPDLVVPSDTLTDFAAVPLGMHLYGQGLALIHTLMAYWMIQGFLALAKDAGAFELAASISWRGKLYLTCSVLQLAAYPCLLNFNDGDWLLAFGAFIVFLLLLEFLLLRIPFRLAKLPPGDDGGKGRNIDWKA